MTNIKTRIEGYKLIIEVDLKERHGRSKSGKTIIIASTQGNQPVDGAPAVSMGLNVYTKGENL